MLALFGSVFGKYDLGEGERGGFPQSPSLEHWISTILGDILLLERGEGIQHPILPGCVEV
jgi:hypothetical protein